MQAQHGRQIICTQSDSSCNLQPVLASSQPSAIYLSRTSPSSFRFKLWRATYRHVQRSPIMLPSSNFKPRALAVDNWSSSSRHIAAEMQQDASMHNSLCKAVPGRSTFKVGLIPACLFPQPPLSSFSILFEAPRPARCERQLVSSSCLSCCWVGRASAMKKVVPHSSCYH